MGLDQFPGHEISPFMPRVVEEEFMIITLGKGE